MLNVGLKHENGTQICPICNKQFILNNISMVKNQFNANVQTTDPNQNLAVKKMQIRSIELADLHHTTFSTSFINTEQINQS